jgi:hypothetical protein
MNRISIRYDVNRLLSELKISTFLEGGYFFQVVATKIILSARQVTGKPNENTNALHSGR